MAELETAEPRNTSHWRGDAMTTNAQSPDELNVLLACYAVERQDDQNTANVSVAVAGVGLTYAAAAVLFSASQQHSTAIPAWLLASIPFPALALTSWYSLLANATMRRGRYMLHLEAR